MWSIKKNNNAYFEFISFISGLGFRHSFASMAVSLPPGLDYQQSTNHILSPTNSSFVSREDLQCNWQDLPKFDIEPVEVDLAKKSSHHIHEEHTFPTTTKVGSV